MQEVIQEIGVKTGELQSALETLLELQAKLPSDAASWTPPAGFSLVDLTVRAGTLTDLIKELAQVPSERFLLAPGTRLISIRDSLQSVGNTLRKLCAQLGSGPIKGIHQTTVFCFSGGARRRCHE